MEFLIHVKPGEDVAPAIEKLRQMGVVYVRQIGKLHVLLAEFDGRRRRTVAAMAGVTSVVPNRSIQLPPWGQAQ